jgi:hypothetical protein
MATEASKDESADAILAAAAPLAALAANSSWLVGREGVGGRSDVVARVGCWRDTGARIWLGPRRSKQRGRLHEPQGLRFASSVTRTHHKRSQRKAPTAT